MHINLAMQNTNSEIVKIFSLQFYVLRDSQITSGYNYECPLEIQKKLKL